MDPGKENSQLEGLCDVIIPAEIQSHDDLRFFIRGGQENDRHGRGLPDLAAQIITGTVGQRNVQNDQIKFLFKPQGFRFLLCPGDVDGVAFFI